MSWFVHEWQEHGALDGPANWCSVSSNAGIALDRCGEEGAEQDGKAQFSGLLTFQCSPMFMSSYMLHAALLISHREFIHPQSAWYSGHASSSFWHSDLVLNTTWIMQYFSLNGGRILKKRFQSGCRVGCAVMGHFARTDVIFCLEILITKLSSVHKTFICIFAIIHIL